MTTDETLKEALAVIELCASLFEEMDSFIWSDDFGHRDYGPARDAVLKFLKDHSE